MTSDDEPRDLPPCARCGERIAPFGIGPPMRRDPIRLCGPCFFAAEGADLQIERLQKVNDD